MGCATTVRYGAAILVAGFCGVATAEPVAGVLPVPFREAFDRAKLDPAWRVDVSPGNAVELQDGMLEIRARMNTHAHIERPLGVDFVRATCAIQPAPAITWCTSLFLYWDAGNWCQMGVINRDGGRYYALEMIDQRPHEYDLGACTFGPWHTVGIELGADCIRYLSSDDGREFQCRRAQRRPPPFAVSPTRLIVGKGHGGPAGYTAPDLDNDYASPGAMGTSRVKDVRVTAVKWAQLRATAAERAAWDEQLLDGPGEKELADDDDPTLESVSRWFPPMKLPREIVGVKDHPHDIGVAADGALQLTDDITDPKATIAFFEIGDPPYRFGSGNEPCRKRLLNGWMPIVVATDRRDGLELEQTIYGWTRDLSPDAPLLAHVRFKARNGADAARSLKLRLRVEPASGKCPPKEWTLNIPPKGAQAIEVTVPFLVREQSPADLDAPEFDARLQRVTESWAKLVGEGSRFDIPEPCVQDAYRAWLAYNFLNVDRRDGVYHICDGAGFYEVVYGYSAALYCHALDLMGYTGQAQVYMDSILSFLQPDGLLCVNFGATDTGTMLLVMCEHYRLTRDAGWLRRMAPKMTAMCNWIIEHRRESMRSVHGGRALVHGLVRWRPYCDYELPAFDYFCNGYLWRGVRAAADAFAEIGLSDESARLQKESEAFRKDILTSMDAAVITHDGVKMLPIMPDTQALLKETNYTANGYYGLLASCLLETGLLAPDDPRADLLVDMLRRKGGLVAGVCQFQNMIDHAYTYGYWMTCLRRDEPKRVILGLYGSLAYGMTRDTYAAVECTRIRSGENWWTLPHTYSNTKQLRLLRNMLLREEGDDLLIGTAVPRPWLAAGKRLAVRKAPTVFGETSFVIESGADAKSVGVHIEPPSRGIPGAVRVRLRHPSRGAIGSVTTSPETPVTFKGEWIELPKLSRPVELKVIY